MAWITKVVADGEEMTRVMFNGQSYFDTDLTLSQRTSISTHTDTTGSITQSPYVETTTYTYTQSGTVSLNRPAPCALSVRVNFDRGAKAVTFAKGATNASLGSWSAGWKKVNTGLGGSQTTDNTAVWTFQSFTVSVLGEGGSIFETKSNRVYSVTAMKGGDE